LVGAPGVGKTAIVHSLAHRVAAGEVPAALRDAEIHEVSIGGLVAGTKYRGDFEQRLKRLVDFIAARRGALVFLDEMHSLVGAGAVAGGALDAASILKPHLASGALRCVGATTHAEFARHLAKDAGLLRRFQRIEVPEPGAAEAEQILAGFVDRLERHHGLPIAAEAVPVAVRLSSRFLPQRHLPDKAIDLLDEAAAAAALANEAGPVGAAELHETVARISGKPRAAIERGDRRRLARLGREMSRRIFGQDQAVTALAKAVRRASLGVGPAGKPIGSFIFAGPTGVGKTETARALADALGYDLERFDMSEYMEMHSVARLIGAPPGYVGHEQRGQLTERVSRHPHCVLLLDEIEKAHPDVFNVLLQVMDYGRLTDGAGLATDFRHAVLIMTTNAGAEAWDRAPLGFADGEPAGDEERAVQRLFAPEFRNRLTDVIRFSPLEPGIARRILDLELRRLAASLLAEHGVRLTARPALRRMLLRDGFSKSFGARPLQRLLAATVVDAVADAHLRGELRPGGEVAVDVDADGAATVSCAPPAAEARPAKATRKKAPAKAAG
ncbi:MAG: AAA family ATPase, partial [Betaproteobacteria bacterium AqS2]|nr:AAA family ATPase [Betaproteobacteria bacterium AqS2]